MNILCEISWLSYIDLTSPNVFSLVMPRSTPQILPRPELESDSLASPSTTPVYTRNTR